MRAEINVALEQEDETEMIKSYAMDLKVQMALQANNNEFEKEKKICLKKKWFKKLDQDFEKKLT